MGMLLRKLIRDIKQSRGQFISLIIVVTIGVMFYSGINSTFRNLNNASIKYYNDYRFGDIWIDFYKAPESVMEKIEKIPYVHMATGRVLMDTSIKISKEDASLRFITLPDNRVNIVNDIDIKSGRYFSGDEANQCLVEEEFFKAHNLKIGDYIYPVVNGNEVKIKVIGSVKSPEFIYTLKDGSELMPDSKKFGIIYVKHSFGQEIFGVRGYINNVSLLLEDGTESESAIEDIKKILKNYAITGIIDREDQISNRMLKTEMDGLEATGGAFPVIFFAAAAVIIYIMMGRMVENQRIQIGVLKALGFTNFQVLLHYLSYSVFVAIVGCILGSISGMYLGIAFTELENMYFHLPLGEMKMYPDLVFSASILTLFFCLIAGYNACKTVFRIMPSEAMKPKAPPIGKKILAERIKIIWSNISNTYKMILRNIFRHKRRALLTSTGVIFSTALLLIALSMNDSINFIIDQQYSNIMDYDIKVNFSKLINVRELDSLKNIDGVTKMEAVLETGVEVQNGWRKKSTGLTSIVREPEMYRVVDKTGQPVKIPERGIVIPEKLAEDLDIKLNDRIFIKPLIPGKDRVEVSVKGIAIQYIGMSIYSSLDDTNHLFGEGVIANSAVLRLENPSYENSVKDKLKDMSAVSSVQSKSDALNALMSNMAVVASAIGVMILLSAILSIAVVYNTATINIFERQRELATLKVLGFKEKEIKKLIFNENHIITAFGLITGLPFGNWLGKYMMSYFSTDFYSFPFVTKYYTYIISSVLTIIFTVVTNLILVKKIKSISIVEVLKNRE